MHEFIVAGAKCEIFWRRPRGFKISWRRPQGFDISWMRPQHLEEASKCLGVGFEISSRRLRNILEESLMLIRRKPHFNHQSISFHKERQHINTILINQTCLYFCCGHYCLSIFHIINNRNNLTILHIHQVFFKLYIPMSSLLIC